MTLNEVGPLLYGPLWQTPLAEALHYSLRQVQRWARSDGRPDADVWAAISVLLSERQREISKAIEDLAVAQPIEIEIALGASLKMPMGCAWKGCRRSYSSSDQPVGWRILITYHSGRSTLAVLDFKDPSFKPERDAVLCPLHAAELEKLLKDI
jgi:hypothetical protein